MAPSRLKTTQALSLAYAPTLRVPCAALAQGVVEFAGSDQEAGDSTHGVGV
jgi:hypothetical protein